ncbi:extensin family protein [Pseudoroseomonas wenyumeiae]
MPAAMSMAAPPAAAASMPRPMPSTLPASPWPMGGRCGCRGTGARRRTAPAAFLRDVRDGACRFFGAVLGPDYNAAHRDHFHMEAGRWQRCS